jgi:hypothetical protein
MAALAHFSHKAKLVSRITWLITRRALRTYAGREKPLPSVMGSGGRAAKISIECD